MERFAQCRAGRDQLSVAQRAFPQMGPCSSREACPCQYRHVLCHDDRWTSSAGHRNKVTGGLPSSLRPSTRGGLRPSRFARHQHPMNPWCSCTKGPHSLARPIAHQHAGLVWMSALQPFSFLEPTKKRLASSRGRHIAKHYHKHFYCLRHRGRRAWRTEASVGSGARCTGCVLLRWL